MTAYDAFTMGFSNRSWEKTLEILRCFGLQRLVDIRTLPGSKHTPQFNLEHLERALPIANVDYIHMKSLGGLRKPQMHSVTNAAWHNNSFRGYADYMQTPAFEDALDRLIGLIKEKRTVYVCTEALFWRCHRQLVSDALTIRGHRIGHIFDAEKVEHHRLTKFSRVEGTRLTYPALL